MSNKRFNQIKQTARKTAKPGFSRKDREDLRDIGVDNAGRVNRGGVRMYGEMKRTQEANNRKGAAKELVTNRAPQKAKKVTTRYRNIV